MEEMCRGHSLTTEQLAERWQRRPQWITQAAKRGGIPGAWKLGHLWRFRLMARLMRLSG